VLPLLLAFAVSRDAPRRTYVANCGVTAYLGYKPDYWSNGCMGGSLNIGKLRWSSYGSTVASATGLASLRKPCGNGPCYKSGVYQAKSRLSLTRPRRCLATGNASGAWYFSRAQVQVLLRRANPFGLRPGWKLYAFTIASGGRCEWAVR
jgi:hypothetical protein